MNHDWTRLVADLERLLKLRAIPFGMKLFKHREEMEAIPKIRRPKSVHTLAQVVAQAARFGWTVGITSVDLVGAQCRAVVGLGLAKDDKWCNTWSAFGTARRRTLARIRRQWIACADARYEALAVAPLASGRLDPPDIALFYATPGAMIYFINGLQWSGYKSVRLEHRWRVGVRGFVGTSTQNPRAESVDPVLCRAPLRRGAR
jgi:uncharacterized protein (DUF169 family)